MDASHWKMLQVGSSFGDSTSSFARLDHGLILLRLLMLMASGARLRAYKKSNDARQSESPSDVSVLSLCKSQHTRCRDDFGSVPGFTTPSSASFTTFVFVSFHSWPPPGAFLLHQQTRRWRSFHAPPVNIDRKFRHGEDKISRNELPEPMSSVAAHVTNNPRERLQGKPAIRGWLVFGHSL